MSKSHKTRDPKPETPIVYSEDLHFEVPVPPSFSVRESLLSILSIIFMATLSALLLVELVAPSSGILLVLERRFAGSLIGDLITFMHPANATGTFPAWTWAPFLFSTLGALVGLALELYLLAAGTPFQIQRNRLTILMQRLRYLNVAPLSMSAVFFVGCMVIEQSSTRMGLLYLAGMGTFVLGTAIFFGGAERYTKLLVPSIQVLKVLMVLGLGPIAGGLRVTQLLVVQSAFQVVALMVSTSTPLRSAFVFFCTSISSLILYASLMLAIAERPSLPWEAAPSLPLGSLVWWGFVFFSLAGMKVAATLWPRTANNARSQISNLIWSITYFPLLSQPRFPNPVNLSQVYNGTTPKLITLAPYWVNHKSFLVPGLNVPSVSEVEAAARVWKDLVKQIELAVGLLEPMGYYFPQTDIRVPLKTKPRMEIWSDGSNYWPKIFSMKIFGMYIPGQALEKTPEPVIKAFREGQLLAYLCEAGLANPYLREPRDDEERQKGALVADFSHLELYDVKPDYAPYGGVAYFKINNERQRLELVSVIAPWTHETLNVDERDPTFRKAEAQILASLYYEMMPGRHLGEIHMTYNLVAAALHNAFDARGKWTHPFRTFMYLHFFNHQLAQEYNTKQLVQNDGVFTQIWATTHVGLVNFLNDTYRHCQIGREQNFEERTRMMTMQEGPHKGQLLPRAAIKWELRYMEIFKRYIDSMILAIYPDDEAVRTDPCMRALASELDLVLVMALPERYKGLETRDGVARFALDVIHHMVIRHAILGTTCARAAFDPRISKAMVPADGGPSGVDEWRTMISMSLATARSRFTLLMGDFKYLIDGVDPKIAPAMREAFDHLQADLKALDAEWTATPEERQFNWDCFRPLPSELHTGPGF